MYAHPHYSRVHFGGPHTPLLLTSVKPMGETYSDSLEIGMAISLRPIYAYVQRFAASISALYLSVTLPRSMYDINSQQIARVTDSTVFVVCLFVMNSLTNDIFSR
jgi:hypothetical protein